MLFIKKLFAASLPLFAIFLVVWPNLSYADTVVAATGGSSISADTAVTGGTGLYTALSGPTYNEVNGGTKIGVGTVVLKLPSGFEFNTTKSINVVLTSGSAKSFKNINGTAVGGNIASTSNGSITFTANTVSFNVTSSSFNNVSDTFVWQGLEVRPLNGSPLATGNIIPSGSSGIAAAVNTSNFGTITEVSGTPKYILTELPGQSFTSGTGITGTASSQTAGSTFSIPAIIATDSFYNQASSYSGTKTVSYTGPTSCFNSSTYTTSVTFTNGVSSAVSTTLYKAENTSITSSDGALSAKASSLLTVNTSTLSKLVTTLPGETFISCAGNSGTPSNQTVGTTFSITSLSATDAFFNVLPTYSGTKNITYSGPTGANSYTSTVTFTNGQSSTSLLTTINQAQTTSITVTDGVITGPVSSSFIVNPPPVSSFNAFETTTSASSSTGVLKTKISGSVFSFDAVALVSNGNVSTSFVGTAKVELVDSSNGSCAAMPLIQLLPNQTFTSTDKGRHTVSNVMETNSWKNARIRLSYPVSNPNVISCSNDNFAIRPGSFNNVVISDADSSTSGTNRTLNNSISSGGVTHKAGQPFTVRATAVNSSNVSTTNYVDSPTSIISQCATAGGVCPSTLGVFSLGSGSTSTGAFISNNASYTEVGDFSVTLIDQNFANVDAADSSTAERYILSSPLVVGRFTPDHFAVMPGITIPRTDIAACGASTFTYMDEPFSVAFTLTALNSGNAITTNYSGVLAALPTSNSSNFNFGAVDTTGPNPLVIGVSSITQSNPGKITTTSAHKLSSGAKIYLSGISGMSLANNKMYTVTVIDANNFTIGVDTSSYGIYVSGGQISRVVVNSLSGGWSAGTSNITAALQLGRNGTPDGPFNNLIFGIVPIDSDGITLQASALNVDTDSTIGNDRASIGTQKSFFGKLNLTNAFGTDLLNLPIPMKVQYWNGATFITNSNDNCSKINSSSSVILSNYQGGITSSNINNPANISLGGNFSSGIGSMNILKPSPKPNARGSVDVTIDLSAENKLYFLGKNAFGNFNKNPSAKAVFGIYKNDPLIYMRELY